MLLGGADPAGDGRVLAYRSADLVSWQYAGVFAAGRVDVGRPHVRQVWECPQLASFGDREVLVVSVQVDGAAGPVLALLGERDGDRFRVCDIQRLISGPAAYATTLFRDRDDRLCMLSWLRDECVRPGREWAGAHSAVSTLGVCDGRVVVAPHPAVPVHWATADIAVCEDLDVLEVWTSGRYGAWWLD
jgi:beta-fructofuranosidase